MQLNFQLDKEDFLDFQLFTVSQSKKVNNQKRTVRIILTLLFVLVGIYFFINNNLFMTIYGVVFAFLSFVLYPKYFKWRYKKHYQNYIEENYAQRFGVPVSLEIKDDKIYSKDSSSEFNTKVTQVQRVDETPRHIFIKLMMGQTLIIPKEQNADFQQFKKKLEDLNFEIIEHQNWKW